MYLYESYSASFARHRQLFVAMGTTPQERWGANLNRYYMGLGWHAGPHVVVCPDYIWVLSDLTQPGVSVSCWNTKTFGVEMVGNYEVGGDDFASGLGAKVRDNAAQAVALLARHFGWGDLSDYLAGERGLHFHRECARDHHPCPGSRVDKQEILDRIQRIRQIGGGDQEGAAGTASPVGQLSSGAVSDDGFVRAVQSELNALEPSARLEIDGVLGPATRAALLAFQMKHDLAEDWEPGSRTRALLSELAERTD